jgi:hypothetical protein
MHSYFSIPLDYIPRRTKGFPRMTSNFHVKTLAERMRTNGEAYQLEKHVESVHAWDTCTEGNCCESKSRGRQIHLRVSLERGQTAADTE